MLSKIKDIATDLEPRLIEIRRHFHTYPELSGQEYKTLFRLDRGQQFSSLNAIS